MAHCAEELGRGNKLMANCNAKVHEMLAMARADFAHGMHLSCKDCMEACDRCASARRAFAA